MGLHAKRPHDDVPMSAPQGEGEVTPHPASIGGTAWHASMGPGSRQIVGMVPPSVTYSLPVIEAA
jgi:hypothetical protein